MTPASLQPGTVATLKSTDAFTDAVTLQLSQLQEGANGKFKCQFSDGKENIPGILTSQVGKRHGSELKEQALVRVKEANINDIENSKVLIVAELDIVQAGTASVGQAAVKAEPGSAQPASPAPTATTGVKAEQENPAVTPARPVLPRTPYGEAPATHPTPPSVGWALRAGSGTARPLQPIGALNPYNNTWTIKAKVASKGQKRSFNKNGMETSLFSVELVDDQGSTIEATFWRAAADKYFDLLAEGSVYTFARGSVKPANKRFSSVRNDYTLNFDAVAEVEPCEGDIDASAMEARLDPVAIAQLPAFVDKKASVDLLGVVTAVAPLGSVKRKADAAELSRRDITLVDQGQRSVVLTLWGATAEGLGAELEARAGDKPLLSASNCRVSSFNGVSASTLQRSAVRIDPQGPEAAALAAWWKQCGSELHFAPVGEGLAGAGQTPGGRGAGGSGQVQTLAEIRAAAPARAEDKPIFSSAVATLAFINPDQTLYYAANPDNNRKVVEQGPGQWYCEYSGTTLPTMVRRYILQAKVMDASGECFVQVFNDQAEQLLGMSADDLATLKESEPARFLAVLKGACWKEWSLRIKASAQEYNGEQRQRFAAADCKTLDFVSESRRMLALLASETAA